MAKKETTSIFTDATFLGKDGKVIALKELLDEKDCWYREAGKAWILSHRGIKKIAAAAGISKSYKVEESPTILPSYKNELEHIVRVTITCNAKKKGKGCMHSDENFLTVTGEANKVNTGARGRGYLRKMAEKRAFDIAVLEHLDLYTNIFSEEESEEFANPETKKDQPKESISNTDIEAVKEEINLLTKTTTKEELDSVSEEIKRRMNDGMYSQTQLEFLRTLHDKQLPRFTNKF